MWDHKIAMATFSTFVRLSSKMAAKFFKKCYEWRCQGIKVQWLDIVFQGQYLPSLSLNCVAINKDLEKLTPQLY